MTDSGHMRSNQCQIVLSLPWLGRWGGGELGGVHSALVLVLQDNEMHDT